MAARDFIENLLDENLVQAKTSVHETLQEKVRGHINMLREDHLLHFFREQDEEGDRPGGDENVEKFIRKELKRMGADSLDDLSDEQKKKLFDKVDAEFESETEEDDDERVNEEIILEFISDWKSQIDAYLSTARGGMMEREGVNSPKAAWNVFIRSGAFEKAKRKGMKKPDMRKAMEQIFPKVSAAEIEKLDRSVGIKESKA